MSSIDKSRLFLELGQVIQIDAPSNTDLHKHIYLIEYLDDNNITLIDNEDLSTLKLKIQDNKFTDETIETISILAKQDNKGYAQQHNLIPGNWISIHFSGDIPAIINGQITNLEEDMIELKIYPSDRTIYIDFAYKGIPLDLPIEKIVPFTPPQKEDEEEDDVAPIEEEYDIDDDLELIADTETLNENLQNIFIDLDDITLGEELGEITEEIGVQAEHRRYGIDTQTNDLLDELLASIPTNERTRKVLNNIHILIERFKELRRTFSKFDEEGNAENIITKGADYKPLVKHLKNLDKKLYWILPLVRNKHKIYNVKFDTCLRKHLTIKIAYFNIFIYFFSDF